MTETRRRTVKIYIDEHADERLTRVEAAADTNDPTHLAGSGTAHRHPGDAPARSCSLAPACRRDAAPPTHWAAITDSFDRLGATYVHALGRQRLVSRGSRQLPPTSRRVRQRSARRPSTEELPDREPAELDYRPVCRRLLK